MWIKINFQCLFPSTRESRKGRILILLSNLILLVLFSLNCLSQKITVQGEYSIFYLPSLTFKKSILDNSL